MVLFRPAQETDLAQVYDVYYENEVLDVPNPPSPDANPTDLWHTFETGIVYVAEMDGSILAFAAAITRENITFLTDLFVRPTQQSAQLGQQLLRYVLPEDKPVRCTLSSTDPRAIALYIRTGMHPLWPHFCLRLDTPLHRELLTDVTILEGTPGDPDFIQWDAQISGRLRPMEHSYWVQKQQAVPLWFLRNGEKVGYGYVRPGAGSLWYPQACTIGPLGVTSPENATACTLAAVNWACVRAKTLLINIPGPHASLAPLLAAGFHITYVETFLSTAMQPFFDARCYIASGSNLF